jgi:hypothetical protein
MSSNNNEGNINQMPKQDVHDLVKTPLLNRSFHILFGLISFGSLQLPTPPEDMNGGLKRTLYRLKGSEFKTTGAWQNLEVHASKYLTPLAGVMLAAGYKKSAFVTLSAMAAISGAGNAMDSVRLFKETDKKDHIAVALGRLGRGVAYGFGSAYMAHLAAAVAAHESPEI